MKIFIRVKKMRKKKQKMERKGNVSELIVERRYAPGNTMSLEETGCARSFNKTRKGLICFLGGLLDMNEYVIAAV